MVQGINAHLPKGLRIMECRLKSEVQKSGPQLLPAVQEFRIELGGIDIDTALLSQFQKSSQWPYRRSRPKKPDQSIDLKAAVNKVEYRKANQLYLGINAQTQVIVRPADFLMSVLQLTPMQLQQTVVTKLAG